jgi:hypothetical protein
MSTQQREPTLRNRAGLLCAFVGMLSLSCGDDDAFSLEAKRLATLTEADLRSLCELRAHCPVTVRQNLDCFESQSPSLQRAATEYTCEAGDEARYYPVPKPCIDYATAVLACVDDAPAP